MTSMTAAKFKKVAEALTQIIAEHPRLVMENERLRVEVKFFRGRSDTLIAMVLRVRALHRPVTICPEADGDWTDPCPCGDPGKHFLVCEACCTDGGSTTRECATYHDDHLSGGPICDTISALDGGDA